MVAKSLPIPSSWVLTQTFDPSIWTNNIKSLAKENIYVKKTCKPLCNVLLSCSLEDLMLQLEQNQPELFRSPNLDCHLPWPILLLPPCDLHDSRMPHFWAWWGQATVIVTPLSGKGAHSQSFHRGNKWSQWRWLEQKTVVQKKTHDIFQLEI